MKVNIEIEKDDGSLSRIYYPMVLKLEHTPGKGEVMLLLTLGNMFRFADDGETEGT